MGQGVELFAYYDYCEAATTSYDPTTCEDIMKQIAHGCNEDGVTKGEIWDLECGFFAFKTLPKDALPPAPTESTSSSSNRRATAVRYAYSQI